MSALRLPLSTKRDGSRAILWWKDSKPFVVNARGILVHRPKSVSMHKIDDRWPTHIGIRFHCGMTANGRAEFTFVDSPDEDAIVCHRCEMFAVAANLPTSSALVGRHVHIGGLKAFKLCGCAE